MLAITRAGLQLYIDESIKRFLNLLFTMAHIPYQSNDIITLEILSQAIEERIGLNPEDAERDAEFLLDLFGFDDRIIDHHLQPEDRQLFYILQDHSLLTTEMEETRIYDGREWRTHYWTFRKNVILNAPENQKRRLKPYSSHHEVEKAYSDIPDDVWKNRKS